MPSDAGGELIKLSVGVSMMVFLKLAPSSGRWCWEGRGGVGAVAWVKLRRFWKAFRLNESGRCLLDLFSSKRILTERYISSLPPWKSTPSCTISPSCNSTGRLSLPAGLSRTWLRKVPEDDLVSRMYSFYMSKCQSIELNRRTSPHLRIYSLLPCHLSRPTLHNGIEKRLCSWRTCNSDWHVAQSIGRYE